MTTIDIRATTVDIYDEAGDTIVVAGPVKNADDTDYEWAGATVEAEIVEAEVRGEDGPVAAQWDVDTGTDGEITMTLSSATTAALGRGTWSWALRVSRGDVRTTWISGTLTLVTTANEAG